MTHAGEFLRRFCERAGGQRKVAAQAGLTEGHFSKIVRGDRRAMRSGTLEAILSALPAEERGEFLTAYVRDIVPEDFIDLLFGGGSAAKVREIPTSYGSESEMAQLDAALRKGFRSPRRAEVVRMLRRLAENCAASPDFLRGLEHLSKLEIS